MLWPSTTYGLSLRLPPSLDINEAKQIVSEFFSQNKALYNAHVELNFIVAAPGFCAKPIKTEIRNCFEQAAKEIFGKPLLRTFGGGTIPIAS